MLYKICQTGRLGCHSRLCLPYALLVCLKRNQSLFSFCWIATFLNTKHCKIFKGEIAQHGHRWEDWLPNSSLIFISSSNYPQLKCISHYFLAGLGCSVSSWLVEKEQKWGAWGDQTCCLLHRKALAKLFLDFNLFPALWSAELLVHSLSWRHQQEYSHEARWRGWDTATPEGRVWGAPGVGLGTCFPIKGQRSSPAPLLSACMDP